MSQQGDRKTQLIEEIIRLQDDFEVLTDRSNTLQHQNQYFQAQLEDLQAQVQLARTQLAMAGPQEPEPEQPQWPLYLKIDNENLPQQPGEYVKFVGNDGRQYVQNIQLVQYVETSPDGKSQHIAKEEYMAVQQPLQMFERQYGPFSEFGSASHSAEKQEQKGEGQPQKLGSQEK